ncbi:MAG: TatD family hydrolase [Gammaproteobacteria bacterium]
MSSLIDKQIPPFYRTIDIHCHRSNTAESCKLVSLDTHELLPLRNTIVSKDPRHSENHDFAPCYLTIGIHPWFIEIQEIATALQTLRSYRNHPKLLAIGECGLDKTIATDLSLQTEVFLRQIELSERWQKPVVVHCVKAFNELIALKKTCEALQPWIIHGFNKHPSVATQLIRHGCYLSFGKALLSETGHAVNVLQNIPINRVFLETDDRNEISIETIYAAAAKIAGISVDTLRREILNNFKRVFLND